MQKYTNNAKSVLSGSISDSAVSITLSAGTGALFASPTTGNHQQLTITDGASIEIVKMTARSGDTLTVTRAQEGTTARTWVSGSKVEARITAGMLDALLQNTATTPNSYALGGNIFPGTIPEWQASHAYSIGDIIRATSADFSAFICSTAGTSGGTEPAWNENRAGDTTTSGAAEFKYIDWIEDTDITDNCTLSNCTSIAYSTALGISAQALSKSVAVGRNAQAWSSSIAIGYDVRAQEKSIAFGTGVLADGASSIAIGNTVNIHTNTSLTVSIGSGNSIASGADYGIVIGHGASIGASSPLAIAIGYATSNSIPQSHVINGASLVSKSAAILAPGYEIAFGSGQKTVISSVEIDLKTLADDAVSISIPAGSTFYPDELGIIITASSGVTGQPSIAFGVTGNTTALLTSTATTGNATHHRDVFAPSSKNGITSITASVKTAATGTTLKGRFYFSGVLVENE